MRFSKPAAAVVAAIAVLLVSAPSASAAGACSAANASASQASKRALVRATLCVLNNARARHNLRPLRLNRKLSRAARRHSRAMARQQVLLAQLAGRRELRRPHPPHRLPLGRAQLVRGREHRLRLRQPLEPSLDRQRLDEQPGHRANILNRRSAQIGIGLACGTPVGRGGATYTTDFGRALLVTRRPRARRPPPQGRTRGRSRSDRARPPRPRAARRATRAVSSTSSGSAPPMVRPPSKRSNTRGSMYEARQTAGVLPR